MTNGALIGVPIPAKYDAVGADIQRAVDQAVTESEQNGINKKGKDVTPWILHRVSELTQGKSMESSQ
jgi:pseudouridylate synthase / pseudouridine kinase